MVCSRRDRRRRHRSRLVALAFAMLLPIATGYAQEVGNVPAVVSPQRVRDGERVLIGIELPPVDAALVTALEPTYPAGLRRVGGVQVVSRGGGPLGPRGTTAQIEFQAVQPGRWIVPPIGFDTPAGRHETEPLLVEVSLRDNPERIPFDVQWSVHRDPVLEGQSVAVTLEMVNVTEFTFPDSVSVQPPAGALFQEAPGIGEISSARYGAIELFRFPVASFLLTPSASGTVMLPAAEIQALGFTRRSAAFQVPVRPLPEGVRESGAIGDLTLVSHVASSEIGVDETVELVMRVRGNGNLGFLQFPDVAADGFVIAETETEDHFVPGAGGFTGERVRTLRLRPTGTGSFRIQVGEFPWFDPDSAQVRRVGARSFTVVVLDDAPGAENDVRPLPDLLTAEEIRRTANLDLFRLPGTYLSLTPVAILMAVVTFVRRRRREKIALFSLVILLGAAFPIPGPPGDATDEVVRAFAEHDYELAWERAVELVREWPEHPGLMYNAAITAFAAQRPAESVFLLRGALVLRPVFRQAHLGLDFVESELGLDRQYSRPRAVHPDGPLFAMIVLWYCIAVLLVVPRRRRSARYAILVIGTALVLAASGGLFAYAMHQRAQSVAVVGEEPVGLRRIPETRAQIWLTLDPGTAVQPLTTRDDYILVRTGFGVEGWMPIDRLLHRGP